MGFRQNRLILRKCRECLITKNNKVFWCFQGDKTENTDPKKINVTLFLHTVNLQKSKSLNLFFSLVILRQLKSPSGPFYLFKFLVLVFNGLLLSGQVISIFAEFKVN